MKKILFLILLSVTAYGQVPADATPLENIQLTNNVVSTGAPSVVVQETNGVMNKINKNDIIEYLEFASAVNLPVTGVAGKLYITRDDNKLYRFNGTIYVPLNEINFIKSNESLSLAKRKGDVLYGILDQYTGEEITLSKVLGTPTVDGVIFFQLGSEYFKRNVVNTYNSEWWGLSTSNTSANNTTALQTAINLVVTLDNLALIERKSIEISLPAGDIQLGNINFKGVVHIKGAGKTATRIYYNGDDYLFKGDTANIRYGGISDLTIVSNNILNKGFIYMINCINMTFDNINLNGAVFAGQILEHSIKLESRESWFIGANNNVFNVVVSNFTIKGGVGDGVHVTGDYGTVQLVLKEGVIEAMDGNAIYITSTSGISNSNIIVDNVICQGYLGSGVVLYQTKGFDFRGYMEQTGASPAFVLGGTKFVQNVRIHDTQIGSAVAGFAGYVFKSGAGLSFSNTNIVIENINLTAPTGSTDVLTDLAGTNIKIKNINFNNGVFLNTFLPYDKELGNYEIEIGYLDDFGFSFKETLYNTPIPNGMISYFRGSSLINTSIRRHRNIINDGQTISQFDINTDINITDRTAMFLGNKGNYFPKRYSCYRVKNNDAIKTINFTVSGATINGLSSFNVLPNESYDVVFDGNANFEFTLVSDGGGNVKLNGVQTINGTKTFVNAISFPSQSFASTSTEARAGNIGGHFAFASAKVGASNNDHVKINTLGVSKTGGALLEVQNKDGIIALKSDLLYTNQTITANKTVTIAEFVNNNELILSVNATSGNITITLPTFTALQGYKVTVKKMDSSANSVLITGVGGVNIDGASTLIISGQYGTATVGSNLSQYIIL